MSTWGAAQGAPRLGRLAPDRLDREAARWHVASDAEPAGLADYVFSFHDDDEIGPRMLARIAKHTGLTPTDL